MDLLDSNVLRKLDRTLFPTDADFARATHDQLTNFLRLRQTSPEAAQMTRDPGLYVPMCGIHIALDGTTNSYARQVRGPGGTPVSFYEALWNWVSGQGPSTVLTDKPPESPPTPRYDALCRDGGPVAAPPPALAAVSAATYQPNEPIAPGSIASVFGADLAPELAVATSLPLPQQLLGTQVGLRDSAGTQRMAQLFAVTPGQLNFVVPAGLAAGTATIGVITGRDQLFTGTVELAAVAPGLFSANAQGSGIAAALFLRISNTGQRTEGLIFQPATLAPVPISLGPEGEQVYLQLFGTGFRGASAVTTSVGGVSVPTLGFAPSPQFAGLDQVAAGPLPRGLAGRGTVDIVITTDGRRSNTVSLTIQ